MSTQKRKHFLFASISVISFLSMKQIWKIMTYQHKIKCNKYISLYMKLRAKYHINMYQFYRYYLPMLLNNVVYLFIINEYKYYDRKIIMKLNKLQIFYNDLCYSVKIGLINMIFCGIIDGMLNDNKIYNPIKIYKNEIINDYILYKNNVSMILNEYFIRYANKNDYYNINGTPLGIEISNIIWDYIPKNSHSITNIKYISQYFKQHLYLAKLEQQKNGNQNEIIKHHECIPNFNYFWSRQLFGFWIDYNTNKDIIDNILNVITWISLNFGWIYLFDIHKSLHKQTWNKYIKMIYFRELPIMSIGFISILITQLFGHINGTHFHDISVIKL